VDKYNKVVGKFGEEYASKYLCFNGYRVLARNYSCRFGEIDIVALDGDCLVFVEVKTRTTDRFGAPEYAVNYYKKKHLELSARCFIEQRRMNEYFCRFDVVEVFANFADNEFSVRSINIIKNAF